MICPPCKAAADWTPEPPPPNRPPVTMSPEYLADARARMHMSCTGTTEGPCPCQHRTSADDETRRATPMSEETN